MNAAQHVFECDDLKKEIFSYCLPKYPIITKKMIDIKMANLAYAYIGGSLFGERVRCLGCLTIEPCIDVTIKGRCLRSAWFRTLQSIFMFHRGPHSVGYVQGRHDIKGALINLQDLEISPYALDDYFRRLPATGQWPRPPRLCYANPEEIDLMIACEDAAAETSSSEEEEYEFEPYEPLLPDDDESSLEAWYDTPYIYV